MPVSIAKIQEQAPARIVEMTVESLKDDERGMDGVVLLRVLPIGQLNDIQSKSGEQEIDPEAPIEVQMASAARLISASLTDEVKTVLSYDEALALCVSEGGLDSIQVKELILAIQQANGLQSGN